MRAGTFPGHAWGVAWDPGSQLRTRALPSIPYRGPVVLKPFGLKCAKEKLRLSQKILSEKEKTRARTDWLLCPRTPRGREQFKNNLVGTGLMKTSPGAERRALLRPEDVACRKKTMWPFQIEPRKINT